MNGIGPAEFIFYPAAGFALGTLFFRLLLQTVRMHAVQAAASLVIALYFARLAVAVAAFWLIAQQGAFPLLLALMGFLLARTVVQRRMRLE